ncbi:MAG: fasciclin domain-containing protein [Ilumatobacteraceae bacterium]
MSFGSNRASFHQRRIVMSGLIALVIVFVVGAPWYVGRIESDLEDRVSVALDQAGFDGVQVSFSGQTGSLWCSRPVARPSEVVAVAAAVRGVRAITDPPDTCRVLSADGGEGGTGSPSTIGDDSTTTTPEDSTIFGTVLDVLATNPQFSLLNQLVRASDAANVLVGDEPITMFAPSDAAFDALAPDVVAQLRSDPALLDEVLRHHIVAGRWSSEGLPDDGLVTIDGGVLTVERSTEPGAAAVVGGVHLLAVDVVAGNGVVHTIDELLVPPSVELDSVVVSGATASFDGESFVLDGVVRSEAERTLIVAAADAVAVRVEDRMAVDPAVGLDDVVVGDFARLVDAVGRHLLSGTVGFDGRSFSASGLVAGGPQRSAFEQAVAGIEVAITLTLAPPVSDGEASELEDELNELVAADPIRFGTGSTRIDADGRAVLAAVVSSLSKFDGVRLTVEGHTDSDGVAEENLTLSRRRAEAVRDVLVELGVDPDSIDAQGFGSERPVIVDGVEDKLASRRVEFRVTVP